MDQIEQTAGEWKAAKEEVKRVRAKLAEEVRQARSNGATLSDIAGVLGVSRERVRQMTGDPADDRQGYLVARDVRCPKCGAGVGEKCGGRGMNHIERYDRYRAVQEGSLIPEPDEIGAMAGAILR